jgi:hypothetical protein
MDAASSTSFFRHQKSASFLLLFSLEFGFLFLILFFTSSSSCLCNSSSSFCRASSSSYGFPLTALISPQSLPDGLSPGKKIFFFLSFQFNLYHQVFFFS